MTDWVRKGFNLMASGRNNVENGSGNNISVANIASAVVLWTSNFTAGEYVADPVYVGGFIYIGSTNGRFYKINATNGQVVTYYDTGSSIRSTAHVESGIAYFGADNGYLYAVTVSTMALLWRSTVQSTAPISCCPLKSGTKVYYGDQAGQLKAALVSNGTESWSSDTSIFAVAADDPGLYGALALYNSKIYVGGGPGSLSYNLSGVNQQLFRAANTCFSGVAMDTDGFGVTHLVISSDDHAFYDYNADNGHRIWEDRQSGKLAAPAAIDVSANGGKGMVGLGTRNFSIQPHELQTGIIRWKRDGTASAQIVAGLTIANGLLFGVWPPDDGRVCAWKLDDTGGGHVPLWKYGTNSGILGSDNPLNTGKWCSAIIANGVIYWAASNGKVYAFA